MGGVQWQWSGAQRYVVAGGVSTRRDSLELGGAVGVGVGALHEYARKWGPSPLSPPLGAALGPVGLRPVSAAPGAETAKYRYTPHTPHTTLLCNSETLKR